MKANSIQFWCVESEFIVKNWTSELGCIWHFFGKLGNFWLFQALQHWQQSDAACTGALKNSLLFQKCAKCTLTLMSNYKINLDSTYQESMKFAFIFTCSIFLQSYCVSDNVNLKVMLKAFISDQNTDTLLRVYAQNLFFGLEPKCGFASTVSFQKAYLK